MKSLAEYSREQGLLSFSSRRLGSWAMSPRVLTVAMGVLALLVWQVSVVALDISRIILPAPTAVALSLIQSLQTLRFYKHIGVTLFESISGFGIGCSFGFALGLLISLVPVLQRIFLPYIVAFETLPKISIAPIVVIWCGYGITSKVVLTALMSFFPVLANTIAGMHATAQEQKELFVAFTANRWQIFWKLNLPNALPYIFVGINLSALLSVIGAIVGEFVGSRAGLGFLMMQRNFDLDMPGMFAILFVLAAMGMMFNWLIQITRKRVIFWMEPQEEGLSANDG
jgi:NitT/TauT family transport system permease protein